MSFDRHRSAGYLVNLLARRFAQALQRRIAPLGISTGQFPILLMLWEREGMTQARLAEELAVEQPTVANTLKRMERDGLIERRPDPEDRRQALVHLTPRGRGLREPSTACADATNAVALAGLSAEERRRFLALVGRIVANLERDAGEVG